VNERTHVPVLLAEVVRALNIEPNGIYVDATYGRGGHASAMLPLLSAQGRLIAFDRDPAAVADAQARFAGEARVQICHAPFSELAPQLQALGMLGRVNGILLDLGVSSPQLDEPARGFSFRTEGPLDMRMNPQAGESAAQWLARAEEEEIVRVLRELGEERFARRIARAIVRARAEQPIVTTAQLRELVARAVPTRERGKDPATRTFQAIRIHVNRELEELAAALPQAVAALAPHGRLAVISFHSLEDRMVKRFLRAESRREHPLPDLPVEIDTPGRLRLVGKKILPGADEVQRNPRARSAVLRVAERVVEAAHA
jgi:16S rRNA (cytosine1402-N4)-methyltransferase